jgi:hypothetical protein
MFVMILIYNCNSSVEEQQEKTGIYVVSAELNHNGNYKQHKSWCIYCHDEHTTLTRHRYQLIVELLDLISSDVDPYSFYTDPDPVFLSIRIRIRIQAKNISTKYVLNSKFYFIYLYYIYLYIYLFIIYFIIK